MDKFKQMLRDHDWYFVYSDDHRVFERGKRQRADIHAEAERLGQPELVKTAFEKFEAGELQSWLEEL